MKELANEISIDEVTPLKKVVKGAGIIFLGLGFSKVINLFTRIFIARYFGPEDYGLYSLGLAVVGFFIVFSVLGFQVGVKRYIPYYQSKKDEARVKGVLVFSLSIVGLASLVIGLILFFTSPLIASKIFRDIKLTNVLRIFSFSIPFTALTAVLSASFLGFTAIRYKVYVERIILNFLKLFFIILFGVLGYGLYGIVFAYTAATVVTFFVAYYFLETRVFSLKTQTSPIYLKKELLVFSIPLMLVGVMDTFLTRIDTMFLGYFETSLEVGLYNSAIPIAQLFGVSISSLGALFLPILTETYAKGQLNTLTVIYKTVTKWVFYINWPILLVMLFFSRHIIGLIFGTAYSSASLSLAILSIGFFSYTLSFAPNSLIITAKKTNIILLFSAFSLIVNVILNLILIPLWGMVGAAVATMLTAALNSVLRVIYSWRVFLISPFSSGMLRSIPAGFISIGTTYLIGKIIIKTINPYFLIFLLGIFLSLYIILVLLFSGLQQEDVEILKAIERKTGLKNKTLRDIIKKFVNR
jgi:O-antigen/teichoic acid export membrane protein